ncbi:tRNA-splicing endonuclease subunit sen54 N-term-domain-containing protein [Phanerochaete sordida]|uniref:tRNA-splicing endonuclease subunit sen54 N-term-domain-containing protein n=1 Tax=Phanerochaete sordida TaxID=48140 RepID=A0A9P3G5D2_9APHY|nr:tRNA-splicing endonuclease subunit sen54 N-term-domain-containing protein [Phanerochaete sordida]
MDDNLEQPDAVALPTAEKREADDDAQSSADEDEGPDWTKLPTVARPVIPKRGEKDFEPKTSGGSGLQRHVLDRARSAMLDALRTTRTTSNKSISYGIWCPGIARAHVTVARGIHFANMGHSVARPSGAAEGNVKSTKRLELLPEEALYLVERGSMFCWKENALIPSPGLEDMEGAPMSVQQAFAEMVGQEDLTLEKYQVYAYLKRLGYVVTRTKPPSDAYPLAAPFDLPRAKPQTFLTRFLAVITSSVTRILTVFKAKLDWWKPIWFSRCLHHNLSYPSLYKSLRFMNSGHHVQLQVQRPAETSPYQIFYNLYKPSTPFKKTSPPPPDFSVVVVNARTTPMPSLTELNDLFEILPELPPPTPRRRTVAPEKPAAPTSQGRDTGGPPAPQSWLERLFPWATSSKSSAAPTRRVNPFAVMKAGKKMVVIAAVDAGTISFFRFGQGAFEDFPMA